VSGKIAEKFHETIPNNLPVLIAQYATRGIAILGMINDPNLGSMVWFHCWLVAL
jgi:hypothetical protein